MPTRLGDESASSRTVTISAIATLAGLAATLVGSLLYPPVIFFAVGAGAGYSLSGSV